MSASTRCWRLLSGSVLGGIAAFLFSTVFITVFAEIFPRAYFSRNALKVASLLSPGVRFYQVLLYPVAKPTAKILDLWLGPEGIHYLREEMLKQYILRSMGVSGSDIGAFEGKGAVNFLDLDNRRVADEGSVLDPGSIVRLPAVGGRLELPGPGGPGWKDFVAQVNASGKRWVVLTDTADAPCLLLDANRLKRLQDVLGTLNDVTVMCHLLGELLVGQSDPEVPAYAFALVSGRTREGCKLLASFEKCWQAFVHERPSKKGSRHISSGWW